MEPFSDSEEEWEMIRNKNHHQILIKSPTDSDYEFCAESDEEKEEMKRVERVKRLEGGEKEEELEYEELVYNTDSSSEFSFGELESENEEEQEEEEEEGEEEKERRELEKMENKFKAEIQRLIEKQLEEMVISREDEEYQEAKEEREYDEEEDQDEDEDEDEEECEDEEEYDEEEEEEEEYEEEEDGEDEDEEEEDDDDDDESGNSVQEEMMSIMLNDMIDRLHHEIEEEQKLTQEIKRQEYEPILSSQFFSDSLSEKRLEKSFNNSSIHMNSSFRAPGELFFQQSSASTTTTTTSVFRHEEETKHLLAQDNFYCSFVSSYSPLASPSSVATNEFSSLFSSICPSEPVSRMEMDMDMDMVIEMETRNNSENEWEQVESEEEKGRRRLQQNLQSKLWMVEESQVSEKDETSDSISSTGSCTFEKITSKEVDESLSYSNLRYPGNENLEINVKSSEIFFGVAPTSPIVQFYMPSSPTFSTRKSKTFDFFGSAASAVWNLIWNVDYEPYNLFLLDHSFGFEKVEREAMADESDPLDP